MLEITEQNIRSFLKTRKDNKYYFKFPWLKGKKTLVVEIEGLMQYWTGRSAGGGKTKIDISEGIKEYICEEAFKTYNKRIKKGGDARHA